MDMNTLITPQELQRRHIRRAQYVSCDDAFIDVRLPGSHPKENYSIIGPGVTQNASQVINLREPHGFGFSRTRHDLLPYMMPT